MGKKIRDESNAKDDAALPKRTKGSRDIAAERRSEERSGWAVGGEGRPSHPDGWRSSR